MSITTVQSTFTDTRDLANPAPEPKVGDWVVDAGDPSDRDLWGVIIREGDGYNIAFPLDGDLNFPRPKTREQLLAELAEGWALASDVHVSLSL